MLTGPEGKCKCVGPDLALGADAPGDRHAPPAVPCRRAVRGGRQLAAGGPAGPDGAGAGGATPAAPVPQGAFVGDVLANGQPGRPDRAGRTIQLVSRVDEVLSVLTLILVKEVLTHRDRGRTWPVREGAQAEGPEAQHCQPGGGARRPRGPLESLRCGGHERSRRAEAWEGSKSFTYGRRIYLSFGRRYPDSSTTYLVAKVPHKADHPPGPEGPKVVCRCVVCFETHTHSEEPPPLEDADGIL